MTTPALFNEYIWLVKTIHEAGGITLAEINELWKQTGLSGGSAMSRTTFYRHKYAIEDIFGIIIDCDKRNGNRYFIGNAEVLSGNSIQNWILTTISVSNVVSESKSLYNRILLEKIPSGDEALQLIIKAMQEGRKLCITYRRYSAPESKDFTVEPYCVKLFRQRWYVLGRLLNGFLSTFSLDRMEGVRLLDEKFRMPDDFDAESYFKDCYGIVTADNLAAERIVLRAYGKERFYLRDLPLHASQRELATAEDYTDYELHLKPTDDFKAKLMSRGQWLEVLEPQSLVEEMIEWYKKGLERYIK
jgi:hypothetical protein